MKKILILYANFGAGHRKVGYSVGNILKKDYDVTYMDIVEETSKAVNKIVLSFNSIIITYFPFIYDYIYFNSMNSLKLGDSFSKIYCNKKILKRLSKINPDLVICTTYFATTAMVYFKERYNFNYKIISIVTDYHIHPYLIFHKNKVDKYFVPSEILKKVLLNNGIKKKNIEVTGIPISEEFYKDVNKNKVLRKYKLSKDKNIILFICGGGIGIPKNFKYFKLLLKSNIEFQYIFVSGTNNKLKRKAIRQSKRSNKKGIVLGYTDDIPSLMNISDLVITKAGGVVISECLSTNRNMIVISAVPAQEKANMDYLEQNNLAVCIRSKRGFVDIVRKSLSKKDCNYDVEIGNVKKIIEKVIK